MRAFRQIVPVGDIDRAAAFYAALLQAPGERVTENRHYFDCGGFLLVCCQPMADAAPPHWGQISFATDEPLSEVRERALAAGAIVDPDRGAIERRPWGEVSFYAADPSGNPFSVIEAGTEYRGGAFEWPLGSPHRI
jgi:catechol 2,3-dioxygenase-like lactoylglutathione lyase family enzyme